MVLVSNPVEQAPFEPHRAMVQCGFTGMSQCFDYFVQGKTSCLVNELEREKASLLAKSFLSLVK